MGEDLTREEKFTDTTTTKTQTTVKETGKVTVTDTATETGKSRLLVTGFRARR